MFAGNSLNRQICLAPCRSAKSALSNLIKKRRCNCETGCASGSCIFHFISSLAACFIWKSCACWLRAHQSCALGDPFCGSDWAFALMLSQHLSARIYNRRCEAAGEVDGWASSLSILSQTLCVNQQISTHSSSLPALKYHVCIGFYSVCH